MTKRRLPQRIQERSLRPLLWALLILGVSGVLVAGFFALQKKENISNAIESFAPPAPEKNEYEESLFLTTPLSKIYKAQRNKTKGLYDITACPRGAAVALVIYGPKKVRVPAAYPLDSQKKWISLEAHIPHLCTLSQKEIHAYLDGLITPETKGLILDGKDPCTDTTPFMENILSHTKERELILLDMQKNDTGKEISQRILAPYLTAHFHWTSPHILSIEKPLNKKEKLLVCVTLTKQNKNALSQWIEKKRQVGVSFVLPEELFCF